MKNIRYILSLSIMAILLVGAGVSGDTPGDLVVTMDSFHRDFADEHSTADFLEGNLTAAGSEFNLITVNDTFSVPSDTDVLLMPGTDVAFTDAEAAMITDWFESEGPKLFWAAGDSDFSGFFDPDPLNTLLTDMGSNLRVGAESIEDPVSNDGAPYRVATINPVTDGTVNAKINDGIDNGIIMHGPAPVVAENDDGEVVSFDEIGGAEVLMETSTDAVAIDSDLSETKYDYYTANDLDAPYPMIAIQDLGNAKWVIVSGEAVFTDYKFMYGVATESGEFNDGVHEGKEFVDNVLHWFSEDAENDRLRGAFLPFNIAPFFAAFVAIALIYRKRR